MKMPKKVKVIYFLFTIFDVNERKKGNNSHFLRGLKHTNLGAVPHNHDLSEAIVNFQC